MSDFEVGGVAFMLEFTLIPGRITNHFYSNTPDFRPDNSDNEQYRIIGKSKQECIDAFKKRLDEL